MEQAEHDKYRGIFKAATSLSLGVLFGYLAYLGLIVSEPEFANTPPTVPLGYIIIKIVSIMLLSYSLVFFSIFVRYILEF